METTKAKMDFKYAIRAAVVSIAFLVIYFWADAAITNEAAHKTVNSLITVSWYYLWYYVSEVGVVVSWVVAGAAVFRAYEKANEADRATAYARKRLAKFEKK